MANLHSALRVALTHHPLLRQLRSFVGVGLVCTALHYVILVALVQLAHVPPVPAALTGFCVAGILSYRLNRRHTFGSERPHGEAVWRFALVAGVAFVLTWLFMRLFVEIRHAPYLPAQMVTTGLVMAWTFAANRFWTFRGER
ncbi:MAG: GtrA family protein [Beijerinckiaceae bacterium]|nr:GtrA family protein [Beijerinckiaceae bacterium]